MANPNVSTEKDKTEHLKAALAGSVGLNLNWQKLLALLAQLLPLVAPFLGDKQQMAKADPAHYACLIDDHGFSQELCDLLCEFGVPVQSVVDKVSEYGKEFVDVANAAVPLLKKWLGL